MSNVLVGAVRHKGEPRNRRSLIRLSEFDASDATTDSSESSPNGPMRLRLRARAAVAMLALIVCGACTKHEERDVTPWLKVDVKRPSTGTSGMIVLGSSEEVFHAKVGDRWVRLGTGHASSYMTLADDRAVLIDLNDRKGLQLVREDAAASPRPVREAFGRGGDVTVPPGGDVIDIFDCRVPATPAGCREAQIYRYEVSGTLLASLPAALPEAYSDCQQLGIKGYDKERIPYVYAQCESRSLQAKCVLVAPRKDGLFVYAVGVEQPWIECSEFSRSGVSLTEPQHFVVLMSGVN